MVARRLLPLPLILSVAAMASLASRPAAAIDYPIPGKIHIVKDAKLNKMVAPGSYTIPGALGPSDPTVVGGSLTVVDTGDSNGFSTTLGAAGWTGLGNPPGSKGYKYKGAGAGSDPCKIVLVKSTIIKFVCKDDQALDPPFTATSFITLSLGTDNYCTEFGGTTVKNIAGLLKRKDAGAPASCAGATTSTSTSSSSTTSTTIGGPCCNSAEAHRFTAIPGGGDCGDLIDSAGVKTKDLSCGGLYVGGGGASVPTATLPDLETFITNITSCTGQSATLGAATSTDTGSNDDCTAVGCLFGPPLPIPSPASTPTSTCVVNVVATNGMGALDCNGGAQTLDIPLASIVHLTGDTATDPSSTIGGIQPCPLCTGTCIGGPNNGLACTAGTTALTPSYPTSNDCPPDPMFDIGTLAIGFSLSTGTVSWTGTSATNDSGSTVSVQNRVFSGFCRNIDTGAFQNPAQQCWENGMAVGPACSGSFGECEQRTNGAFGPNGGASKTITEIGAPQTGIFFGPAAGTMVSVFSIPQTFDPTVDAVGDLPGPGAVALPGSGTLCATAATCP